MITEFLITMRDEVFKHCTDDYSKEWPFKFIKAIQTDRSISDLIIPQFLLFVLQDLDCLDVKTMLTNWLITGERDKTAVNTNKARWIVSNYSFYDSTSAVDACDAVLRDDFATVADIAAEAAYDETCAEVYDSYGEELLRLMRETI